MRQYLRSRVERFLLSVIILIAALLASCFSSPHRAPVNEVDQPPDIRIKHHIVAKGETLYSIAWRYDVDYRKLARANQLGSDFTIYPGQRLRLDVDQALAARPASPPKRIAQRSPGPTPAPAAAAPSASHRSSPRTTSRLENQTKRPPPVSAGSVTTPPTDWRWPLRGALASRFQSNGGLNKGIDIHGELGEPVIAAAGGEVVYAGSGLRGYGKLLIIKHSEKYLSAYAHNSELLTEEGETVHAGQKIAEVGATGTDSPKLHFEIRYDGKPVDPLKYLPAQ